MNQVVIDWDILTDADSFYDSVFLQTGAPDWHGRNLDAINDAWVAGDICSGGPPFNFLMKGTPNSRLIRLCLSIEEIIRDSISEQGGTFVKQAP
jgi:RNAse (barnase) inhibitor barstar